MLELLHQMNFSPDFVRLNRQQHLHNHSLLAFGILPLENMGVSASAQLMTDCILFKLAA